MSLYLHTDERAVPVVKSRRLKVVYGYYDTAKHRIVVDGRITGEKALEIYIHEALHACLPDLSEEAVTKTAKSIANLLDQDEVRAQTDV